MLSFKSNVYKDGWLDLVFKNRNQMYGAYELRRTYSETLLKALGISIFLFVSVISGPFFYHKFFKKDVIASAKIPLIKDNTEVVYILPKKQLVEQPKKEAAPAKQEAPKIQTTKFIVPTIVKNAPDDMPTIKDLQNSLIGTQTIEGDKPGAGTPVEPEKETGNGNGTSAGDDEGHVYLEAGKAPEFPGGPEAFAKFIRRNLRYPGRASDANIGGKVLVSFVVERDGSMTDVKVLKGIGFGCDEEAIRVLKKVPSWIPGEQNGRKVRVQYLVPLVFSVEN